MDNLDAMNVNTMDDSIMDDPMINDFITDDSIKDIQTEKSDLSEPGYVMSADEIEALIANTDSLADPEPIITESDMPDLSPGHVMSADEIAALIANM